MTVSIISLNDTDYISLTDIAKFKTDDTSAVIGNWMRNRNSIEFLGIWETLYNPNFKPFEFERFRSEAGLNIFTMSSIKMDNYDRSNRFYCKIRSLWRYFCS